MAAREPKGTRGQSVAFMIAVRLIRGSRSAWLRQTSLIRLESANASNTTRGWHVR
jgi:hypothetical protein